MYPVGFNLALTLGRETSGTPKFSLPDRIVELFSNALDKLRTYSNSVSILREFNRTTTLIERETTPDHYLKIDSRSYLIHSDTEKQY